MHKASLEDSTGILKEIIDWVSYILEFITTKGKRVHHLDISPLVNPLSHSQRETLRDELDKLFDFYDSSFLRRMEKVSSVPSSAIDSSTAKLHQTCVFPDLILIPTLSQAFDRMMYDILFSQHKFKIVSSTSPWIRIGET